MRRTAVSAALIGVALAASPACASDYHGVLATPGIVWISTTAAPPQPVDAMIRQTGRTFVPDTLVVPVGTSVRFPNDDSFYHSVYSESPGNAFDLGLYDEGPGKTVSFTTPGIVNVRCHVHGSMHATIVVVDGPWTRTYAPNAPYRLQGLPRGRHQLHVWTLGNDVAVSTIVVK